jgi:hypothetical protein
MAAMTREQIAAIPRRSAREIIALVSSNCAREASDEND